ncbi:hypothetical protein B9Q13_02895 [Candidatus Marsarchaeota G2 archaeon ECH_B_SAG-G16]|uniref:DUF2286 domain-containing protein n=4 Tax=Candidatus Marsarchaeota TaxID=1978152 RepID=A0A2R6ADX7_9ARCH|nr:MAG: hypothetical protein B9Q01_00105 [Candidatus Marsarchaeota G1 archaeon OSP_D]PSN89657.1 MAG: hypothetical protein B9Q00_00105 [Candidatus Marsarchaeota G1 archaeon OSP_C]PSO05084.1 MAG: hypothetical protein B9Q13_02895 [Candidatus Marsarchaeota G2 archaeon ECH_B_SAG-G16]
MAENLVIYCSDGKITKEQIVSGDLDKVVKEHVVKALELWQPNESDFMVFMTKNEAELSAPLSKELLERVRAYAPVRKGDKVMFDLPVYVISYKIEQRSQNEYKDRAIIMISPYINEELKRQVEEWSKEFTTSSLAAERMSE